MKFFIAKYSLKIPLQQKSLRKRSSSWTLKKLQVYLLQVFFVIISVIFLPRRPQFKISFERGKKSPSNKMVWLLLLLFFLVITRTICIQRKVKMVLKLTTVSFKSKSENWVSLKLNICVIKTSYRGGVGRRVSNTSWVEANMKSLSL